MSQAAERYLGHPKLYSRWLTDYLVDTLLAPAQIQSASMRAGPGRKVVELIRAEVAGGHFNAPEIARRLRSLERDGLYFSSLVYALLALYEERLASRFTNRRAAVENG